jgi:hypothetical protein
MAYAGAAEATFPTVATTTSNGDSSAVTSHTVNMPASVVSGDLLLVAGVCRNSITGDIGWPVGWTQIFRIASRQGGADCGAGGSTDVCVGAAYRVSNGSEGASITTTTSGSVGCAWASARISTGTFDAATAPSATASAGGSSSNPDPPSHTAAWGSADNQWFAIEGSTGNNTSVSAYPTSYASNQISSCATVATSVCLGFSRRDNATATEDPATYTINNGPANYASATIVVRPASGCRPRMAMGMLGC